MIASTMLPPSKESRSLADLLAFARYVVIGANSGGDQVQAFLETRGKTVVAFADLDPSRCAGKWGGHDVVTLSAAGRLADGGTAFVIGTVRQREAFERLIDGVGVPARCVFPFVNQMFAAHYDPLRWRRLAPRLSRVRAQLSDARSQVHFDHVVEFFRTLDARHLTPNPNRRGHYGYDAPGANPRPGDTIVDCGAFTGDTFADYLAATVGNCRIFALEAFLPNLQVLLANVAARGLSSIVTPLHVAVSAARGALLVAGDATAPDGGATVGSPRSGRRDLALAETLDALFLEHFPQRIDYLKVDVEGADLDALKGGARLLRAHRPVVAVAAYHCPEHVVEIAELLTRLLHPCRLYAAHDPAWMFHIHYIAVPCERALT